jgi:hypothetical protein
LRLTACRASAAGPKPMNRPTPGLRGAAEDPVRQLERPEQLAVGEQHLGLAEHEHALLVQREGEALEDPGLRLGREVHEHVAADQQRRCARSARPRAGRAGRR